MRIARGTPNFVSISANWGMEAAFHPAEVHPSFGDRAVDIVADRLGEFRLAAVGGDHAGVGEQSGEFTIQQRTRDAGGQRPGVEAIEPVGEIGVASGAQQLRRRRCLRGRRQ